MDKVRVWALHACTNIQGLGGPDTLGGPLKLIVNNILGFKPLISGGYSLLFAS